MSRASTLLTINHMSRKVDQYAAVRKWTQKFDLFAKRFVIIPINEQCVCLAQRTAPARCS